MNWVTWAVLVAYFGLSVFAWGVFIHDIRRIFWKPKEPDSA